MLDMSLEEKESLTPTGFEPVRRKLQQILSLPPWTKLGHSVGSALCGVRTRDLRLPCTESNDSGHKTNALDQLSYES
jgi:hypothetical protein